MTVVSDRASVEVLGDDAVAAALRAGGLPPTAVDQPLTIGSSGSDRAEALVAGQRAAHGAGRSFLPVRTKGATVEIGPLVVPGQPGCVRCVETRHRSVLSEAPMHERLATEGARVDVPAHWARLVAALVVDRLVTGSSRDVVQVVSLPEGTVSRHRLTPVPDCEECDHRPPDGAGPARLVFSPRRQAEPGALRIKALPEADQLREQLLDHRYGPVTHVFRDPVAPMAFCGAEVAMTHGIGRMTGYGRASNFDEAERVAFVEAVERESGALPAGRRTVVHDTYQALAEHAVDPAELGLPDPAFDGHPHSLLHPYSPVERTSWVWAHSFTGDPVLVPEHVAYFGARPAFGGRFLFESSNGCAVGGCIEEAVLHGCLEVIERDAFLLAWYGRRPGIPVRVGRGLDPLSNHLASCVRAHGFELLLFDITTEVGIPVIWALALDPGRPDGASLSAAGAHPDPLRAVRASLVEVAAMVAMNVRSGSPKDRDARLAMLDDPTLVRTIDDHVALHTLPEALDRFGWLLDDPREACELEDLRGGSLTRWLRSDLTTTTGLVVEAMLAAGVRPLVVRQTSARDEVLGLEVVKVVAPGAVPMTFGHVHHRTRGIPRLDAIRAERGADGPVLPHPFP